LGSSKLKEERIQHKGQKRKGVSGGIITHLLLVFN